MENIICRVIAWAPVWVTTLLIEMWALWEIYIREQGIWLHRGTADFFHFAAGLVLVITFIAIVVIGFALLIGWALHLNDKCDERAHKQEMEKI